MDNKSKNYNQNMISIMMKMQIQHYRQKELKDKQKLDQRMEDDTTINLKNMFNSQLKYNSDL